MEAINPYKVEYVSVELTSQCQLDCEVCARRTMTRAQGCMPMDVVRKAAEQVRRLPDLQYVVLNCWGEPTLHPQVLDIIPMFAGLRSVMSTNCVEYIPGLRTSGLRELILSTDAQGVRRDNALRYLAEPFGAQLHVQLLVQPHTQHKVEEFLKTFRPLMRRYEEAFIYLKYPVLDPAAGPPRKPLRTDLGSFADPGVVVVGGRIGDQRGKSCGGGTNTLVVQSDGDVMLHCCTVNKEMVIGTIDDDLGGLLNSERAAELRAAGGYCGLCRSQYTRE